MRNTKAGFSLIEAVITVMLIAIVAVAALSIFAYCYRLALQADARIVAANFARETMEGLYKKDYGDTGLNETVTHADPLPAGTEFGGGFLGRYPTATREYTIAENAATEQSSDYKLITVTMTWS